jgi:hypothetical protein
LTGAVQVTVFMSKWKKKKKRGLEEEKREKVFCVPLSFLSRQITVLFKSRRNCCSKKKKKKKKKKKDVFDQVAFLKDNRLSMMLSSVRPTTKIVFYALCKSISVQIDISKVDLQFSSYAGM